ncbi:16497_t:CDS:1, partial [Dentiscutata heterogama]
ETLIIGNSEISKSFRVGRGVRQGDSLSPLLYILAFEPLLTQLKKNLGGIPLATQHFKFAAYTNDLSIRIGSLTDWESLNNTIEVYEKASNAK